MEFCCCTVAGKGGCSEEWGKGKFKSETYKICESELSRALKTMSQVAAAGVFIFWRQLSAGRRSKHVTPQNWQ